MKALVKENKTTLVSLPDLFRQSSVFCHSCECRNLRDSGTTAGMTGVVNGNIYDLISYAIKKRENLVLFTRI